MVGFVTRTGSAVGLAVCACAADPPAFPEAADTSVGTGDGTGTPASTGEDDAIGTNGDDPSDTGTATGLSTGGPPGATMLALDLELLDFEHVALDDLLALEVMVHNVGSDPAVDLVPRDPEGSFTLTDVDCDTILPAGESCSVMVAFMPDAFGVHDSAMQVDASNATSAMVRLTGVGVGTTDNLVQNGDAEVLGSPPPEWTILQGDWSAIENADPHAGVGAFVGQRGFGGAGVGLSQELDVAPRLGGLDSSSVTVRVTGWKRSTSGRGFGTALTWIELQQIDRARATALWSSPSTNAFDWTEVTHEAVLPSGVARLRVVLECEPGPLGNGCTAAFDDVAVTLAYDP